MPQRESDSSRKCHHYSDTLLVLHARPDAAKINRVDLVETFRRLLHHGAHWAENARVVMGHVETPEGGDRALDLCGGLCFLRDIAADSDSLMTGRFKRLRSRVQRPASGPNCRFFQVGQH
jgi:hypothetical protein